MNNLIKFRWLIIYVCVGHSIVHIWASCCWNFAVDARKKVLSIICHLLCVVHQLLCVVRHLLWVKSTRLVVGLLSLTCAKHHIAWDLSRTWERLEARLHLCILLGIVLEISTWDRFSVAKLTQSLLSLLVQLIGVNFFQYMGLLAIGVHCRRWLEYICIVWSSGFLIESEDGLIGLLWSSRLERVEEVITPEVDIKLLSIEWLDLPVVLLPGKGQATWWGRHLSSLTFLTKLHTAILRYIRCHIGRLDRDRNRLESSLRSRWFIHICTIEIWLWRWCSQALEEIWLQALNRCQVLSLRGGCWKHCIVLICGRGSFVFSYYVKGGAGLATGFYEFGVFIICWYVVLTYSFFNFLSDCSLGFGGQLSLLPWVQRCLMVWFTILIHSILLIKELGVLVAS